MELYSLYLPVELKRALKALKTRDGISESEAIRRAIGEFLTRRKIRIGSTEKGGTRPKGR